MGVRFQLDPAAETRLDLAATATVVCLAVAAHPIVRIVVRARFVIVSAVVAVLLVAALRLLLDNNSVQQCVVLQSFHQLVVDDALYHHHHHTVVFHSTISLGQGSLFVVVTSFLYPMHKKTTRPAIEMD